MANPSTKPAAILIRRLGGAGAVASELGKKQVTVKMWAFRDAIPRTSWPDILDAYPELSMDDLRALERAEPSQ